MRWTRVIGVAAGLAMLSLKVGVFRRMRRRVSDPKNGRCPHCDERLVQTDDILVCPLCLSSWRVGRGAR